MPQPPNPGPIAVKATTAAAMLEVSRAHVYELMARGVLRRVQVKGSNAIRIPIEDVYAAAGMDVPTDGAA